MNRKFIFILLGLVVAAEIVWAGWTLSKGTTPIPRAVVSTQTPIAQVSLISSQPSVPVGGTITVDINLETLRNTDGTDIVISFDPKKLTAGVEVTTGTIYSDYPQKSVDNSLGRIAISGITSQVGGTKASGKFGEITFVAKEKGLTKINIEYTRGSTGDTNVIESESSEDILEKVNNLEITIL